MTTHRPPPPLPPGASLEDELNFASSLISEANAVLRLHDEATTAIDGISDDLPVLTEVIFDLGETKPKPKTSAPPAPPDTGTAAEIVFDLVDTNTPPARTAAQPRPTPQPIPPRPTPAPRATPPVQPLRSTTPTPPHPQSGMTPNRPTASQPKASVPPRQPTPQQQANIATRRPSATPPKATLAPRSPAAQPQTETAARPPASKQQANITPSPAPQPQTGTGAVPRQPTPTPAPTSPRLTVPQPQPRPTLLQQAGIPTRRPFEPLLPPLSATRVEAPPAPPPQASATVVPPAPIAPPAPKVPAPSSPPQVDASAQAKLITEELKLLDSFIIKEVETWARNELPALVVREVAKLNERVRAEAIAQLRATLLPRLSAQIEEKINKIKGG